MPLVLIWRVGDDAMRIVEIPDARSIDDETDAPIVRRLAGKIQRATFRVGIALAGNVTTEVIQRQSADAPVVELDVFEVQHVIDVVGILVELPGNQGGQCENGCCCTHRSNLDHLAGGVKHALKRTPITWSWVW